jgi:site-specific DNA-methyltransferase (adenine-specific)
MLTPDDYDGLEDFLRARDYGFALIRARMAAGGPGWKMSETFLDGRVTLHCGDCLDVLAGMAENSIDAVVCDPPYHLQSIHKRFAKVGLNDKTRTTSGPHQRTARGFMNKLWDGGDVAFKVDTWEAVFRVMKPGAHLVAFGGTRTYHRLACAIEDAGFEIRDQIQWIFGVGFPKSLNISKAIDLAAGAERTEITGRSARHGGGAAFAEGHGGFNTERRVVLHAPAIPAARQWEGWGTALKPAHEPIVLARKPLSEDTVAANVLRWGTGAVNVDGCRVGDEVLPELKAGQAQLGAFERHNMVTPERVGRWPANVIHDGSEEVVAGFPETVSGSRHAGYYGYLGGDVYSRRPSGPMPAVDVDSGSAARFFYTAKADGDERIGSKHPTVKPLDLMQYLVRLVTPPKGALLDPFAGTGTTGEAAFREGFNAVLIEREAEYQQDIRRRMAMAMAGPDERSRESIKARGQVASPGPLFE